MKECNTIVDFHAVRCGVCKTRLATQLCDFITNRKNITWHRDWETFCHQQLYQTCDYPMCKECSDKVGSFDYCPYHFHDKQNEDMKSKNYEEKIDEWQISVLMADKERRGR